MPTPLPVLGPAFPSSSPFSAVPGVPPSFPTCPLALSCPRQLNCSLLLSPWPCWPIPSPRRLAPEHLPQLASDVRSIGTVREKNGQPPLADALNMFFRLFVHVLEIEDGDNENHASSLAKMSSYTQA